MSETEKLIASLKGSENGQSGRSGQGTELEFPVNYFPEPFDKVIRELHKCNNFPLEFTGSALISVASSIIGNKRKCEVKNTWVELCMIWILLVGQSGIKKNPVIDLLTKPLRDHTRENYLQYKIDKVNKPDENITPYLKHIINVSTLEGILKTLKYNDTGVLLSNGEASSWLGSFNKYNGGKGDKQSYMDIFSGSDISSTYSSKDDFVISNPFVSYLGGIQPELLGSVINESNISDGFALRFLYAYCPERVQEVWSDSEVSKDQLEDFYACLERLFEIPDTKIIRMNTQAKKSFEDYYNLTHSKTDETDILLNGKYIGYVVRLAIVFQGLEYSTGATGFDELENDNLIRAVELMNYFRNTYKIFQSSGIVPQSDDDLVIEVLELYQSLGPQEIATYTGIKLDTLKRRTLKRLIQNGRIKKIGHGKYSLFTQSTLSTSSTMSPIKGIR